MLDKKTAVKAGAAIISADEMRKIRGEIEKGKANNNAAIISKDELERMRGEAVIKSVAQLRQEKKMLDGQKETQLQQNKLRRERMTNADNMRATKLSTVSAVSKKANEPDNLLAKAMEQMDEEHDDVKHMNQLMLQTKVMTIRDMQLAENKKLEEEWLDEQKRLDMMMEIERLKAIRTENERNEKKRQAV